MRLAVHFLGRFLTEFLSWCCHADDLGFENLWWQEGGTMLEFVPAFRLQQGGVRAQASLGSPAPPTPALLAPQTSASRYKPRSSHVCRKPEAQTN